MTLETTMILRQVLYQALLAIEEGKDLEYVVGAIQVMCSKDDIATVKEQVKLTAAQKN